MKSLLLMTLAGFLLTLISGSADAYLGEKKIISLQQKNSLSGLSGQADFTSEDSEMEGRALRQYINKQGVVFAVSWSGFAHPDLQILLGSYFPAYLRMSPFNNSKQRVPHRTGAYYGTKKNIVVKMGGHMGHVVGLAFDPLNAPPSFHPELGL